MTRIQVAALEFITRYKKENGVTPTYDEIAAALNLHSKSGISRIVNALVRQKKLTKAFGIARGLEVIQVATYSIDPSIAGVLEAYCDRTRAVPTAIVGEALLEYFVKRGFPEAEERR